MYSVFDFQYHKETNVVIIFMIFKWNMLIKICIAHKLIKFQYLEWNSNVMLLQGIAIVFLLNSLFLLQNYYFS